MNDTESILIVDDDEGTCRTLALILGREGYETETALNAREALEKARDRLFSLALVDIQLPDISGLDMLTSLSDIQPDIVTIIITGHASVESAVQALGKGAAAYLTKPLHMDEALATVHLGVQRHQMAREKRRAEQALQESLERFDLAVRGAAEGLWDWDILRNEVFMSPRFKGLLGYEDNEFDSSFDAWESRVHPDDHDRVLAAVRQHLERRGDPYDVQYRLRTKPGGYRWFSARGQAVWNEQGRAVRMAGSVRDITDRRRMEDKLRESEERYRLVARATFNAIRDWDLTSNTVQWSPEVETLFGYSVDEIGPAVGWWKERVHPEDRERVELSMHDILDNGDEIWREEYRFRCADGSYSVVTDRGSVLRDRKGKPIRQISAMMDVTGERRLQEQVYRKSRLEGVGKLAAGVAHDFNNLLTGIKGYANLALGEAAEASSMARDLGEVQKLADRAAGLARQLLLFSRQQPIEPVVMNINSLVEKITKMLRRLIGEEIELEFIPAEDLWNVEADAGQLEQVLMNLVVNARDAMPRGGKLTIETSNAELDQTYAKEHAGVEPGEYVMLAVTDTGCGMDEAMQQHIFEPFYTTKGPDKGTGLGLSTAYGIVKQHGGNIWLYSERGRGTTFKVYLPSVTEEAEVKAAEASQEESPRGTETILLVEDEGAVLAVGERVLRAQGYEVLTASCPAEAKEVESQHDGRLDLLLTDVVMPGSSGRVLFDDLRERREDLRVLYISGYADGAIVHHGVLDPGTPFLQKPFTGERLGRKVREVLDGGEREEVRAPFGGSGKVVTGSVLSRI